MKEIMPRKKILVSLSYYYPNISGLTKYAKILAENLAIDNNIDLITSRHIKTIKKKEVLGGVNVIRFNGILIGKWFYMPFFLIKSIKKVYKSNVLILHLPSIENVFLSLIGKLFNKKVVSIYHCKFKSGNIFVDIFLEKWQSLGILLSDKVVVNSIDYIDGYNLLSKFREKTLEIYPPILITKTKEKYDFGNKIIIGYLGRISKEKNVEILINAAKKLGKGYMFILAGPNKSVGEKKYINKINRLVKKMKNVKIFGEIESPEKFYNSINCLVLPSNNELESFGMVSAEAIKCNCPVIASNRPGIRIPVQISKCGELFDETNTDDLVNKIIILTAKKIALQNYKNNLFNLNSFFESYRRII